MITFTHSLNIEDYYDVNNMNCSYDGIIIKYQIV